MIDIHSTIESQPQCISYRFLAQSHKIVHMEGELRTAKFCSEMKVQERLSLYYILTSWTLPEYQKLGPQKVNHCHHIGLFDPWQSEKDYEMSSMWNPGVLAWIIKEETVNGKP